MPRSKQIFIASSGAAKPLADALAKYLNEKLNETAKTVVIRKWWEFPIGKNLFELLKKNSKECDYAIVLLTRDDKTQKKGVKDLSPRDNTIFELGLFAGELGMENCAIVCNASEPALPSDISGVLRADFHASLDLSTPDGRAKAIEEFGPKVLDGINISTCFSHPKLPLISKEEISELERPIPHGKLQLEPSTIAVIVNSVMPVEQGDREFCRGILQNLRQKAQYEYFFGNFEEQISRAVTLVETIATANLGEQPVAKNLDLVRENLEWMKGRLKIHFRNSPPLQFCVHNATSVEYANCYLRYQGPGPDGQRVDGFVEWASRGEAIRVARDIREACVTEGRLSILHSTKDVILSEDALVWAGTRSSAPGYDTKALMVNRRELVEGKIGDIFPSDVPKEFLKEVTQYCLG